jgi:peptide deformylase
MELWVLTLADDMWMTMLMSKAVGLAANQVGMDYRMITVMGDEFQGPMINPVILEKSPEIFHYPEGCLSSPGYAFDTGKRSKEICVSYYDLEGKSHFANFSGMTAVIIQHEVDHLEGILFMDYIDNRLYGK